MTMPLLSGQELAARMMEIRPDIPVILCTGYSENVDIRMIGKKGIRTLLMKPLTMKQLAVSIREVLGGQTGRSGLSAALVAIGGIRPPEKRRDQEIRVLAAATIFSRISS
jgi:CheY-like chemotaxis protein